MGILVLVVIVAIAVGGRTAFGLIVFGVLGYIILNGGHL